MMTLILWWFGPGDPRGIDACLCVNLLKRWWCFHQYDSSVDRTVAMCDR